MAAARMHTAFGSWCIALHVETADPCIHRATLVEMQVDVSYADSPTSGDTGPLAYWNGEYAPQQVCAC